MKIENVKENNIDINESIYKIFSYSIYNPNKEKALEKWNNYLNSENTQILVANVNDDYIGFVVFVINNEKVIILKTYILLLAES